ncbi:hypothetical protein H0A73_07135 [Alcaligenaceae bacterium]|nr:hypothetical protein [Alcaligenaceae bacterium]
MPIKSQAINHFANGIALDVMAEDLPLRAYVAICEPDPEAVIGFVPPEQFEDGGNLHVAAIGSPEEAAAAVEDVLFNMEADDAVAFLCADTASWLATLELLGYASDPSSLK